MNLSTKTTKLNDQQRFIQKLHHDNRNSFVSKFIPHIGNYSSRCLGEMEDTSSNTNIYISLNGFTTYGRKAENIRQINCIYYDLDMHIAPKNKHQQASKDYIAECIGNTLNVLYDAINNDSLPEPTMITNTGRGIGMFYVLERSIACAAGRNANQVNLYKMIYRSLGEQIKNIIVPANNSMAQNPDALLEYDPKVVCDITRIVRLPLTVNQSNGAICQLVDDTGSYYSLQDLTSYIYKEKTSYKKYGNILKVNFSSDMFHLERKRALEILQQKRHYKCVGNREYMCFVYYNEVKQLYDFSTASKMLQDYNEQFEEGLSNHEIRSIINGIDKNLMPTHEGYYKLSNEWISEKCGVANEERDEIGLKFTAKQLKRKAIKEAHEKARNDRNKQLIEYTYGHPDVRYEDIAEMFDVSISLLKHVLRTAQYRRNQSHKSRNEKSSKECPIVCCDSEFKEIQTKEVPDLKESIDIMMSSLRESTNINSLLIDVHFFARDGGLFVVDENGEYYRMSTLNENTRFIHGGSARIVTGYGGKLVEMHFKLCSNIVKFSHICGFL